MDVGNSPQGRRIVSLLALALGCAGCANYIGTTAASFLSKARTSPDPNVRYLAYQKLASPSSYDNDEQKVQAAQLLSERLKSGQEPLASRAVICRTLGELRRPEGHDALAAAINDEEPLIRTEACRALGKLGRVDDATELGRIVSADQSIDCKIAAIEGLGEMKAKDPRFQLQLVEAMENDDPSIRVAAVRSLRKLSGKDLGVDPKPWRQDVEARLAAFTGIPAPPEAPAQAPAIATRPDETPSAEPLRR
jgi:HEAT repeat protein